jgi:hypothetical protein
MAFDKQPRRKRKHNGVCEQCGEKSKIPDCAWSRASAPRCPLCGGMMHPCSRVTRHIAGNLS